MFKKKIKSEIPLTKIQRRVSSLPTTELLAWTDQIIYSVGRNLSAWQKTQHDASLEEARMGAEALHAILETLNARSVKK